VVAGIPAASAAAASKATIQHPPKVDGTDGTTCQGDNARSSTRAEKPPLCIDLAHQTPQPDTLGMMVTILLRNV